MSGETKLIDAVRRKREVEGLSIRALSAIVGISFSSLARIERGDGLPDANSRIRLIEWLGSEAEEAGLGFDRVALVHFRAMKNVRSGTVQALLKAADCLKHASDVDVSDISGTTVGGDDPVALSKEELEAAAAKFRKDLGLSKDAALDSLRLNVDGIDVVRVTKSDCIDRRTIRYLSSDACSEWSAMSVPLSLESDRWVVLLNDCHAMERQRVTILEEYWHILLGHKLTKVARIAEAYGRTYDKVEEHDAYYLASAALLPKEAVTRAVADRRTSTDIARRFGTSPELVEYRIKRLGLWREYRGRTVALD